MITIKEITLRPNWKQIVAIILAVTLAYCMLKDPDKTVENTTKVIYKKINLD